MDTPGLAGKRVLLGVTGSIAAYRAADIAGKLSALGADVHVVLTQSGATFIGPATFRALTGNPVLTGVFDEPYGSRVAHIHIAQSCDLFLVAPATANVLAKLANGIADDMLTTLALATTAPLCLAPAMNTVMLQHPATQANLRTLIDRGAHVIEPAVGRLACGTEGQGRLAPVDAIVQRASELLRPKADLAGVRVLVTAGPTQEPLDPVRYLTNRSSGKQGFAVAQAALERGAQVVLVAGPTSAQPPAGVELVRVRTTAEMLQAAREAFGSCRLVVAAGAPADYAPVEVAASKLKKDPSGAPLRLELAQTPDILADLAARRTGQVLVGFAAETDDVLAGARAKLAKKGLDLIVANDVSRTDAGFDVDTNAAVILGADGSRFEVPVGPKIALAHAILDRSLPLLRERGLPTAR